ncbi:MAG: aldehyde dehydrogenase family protein [Candidatus Fonsibacter ubiquis]|nr:aldehyde dehydrogenase family protein [Candidatus Fonsibacter ubiquis]
MKIIEHFVNGKSFSGSSKKTSEVFNPATGEVSAKVNLASKKDVDDVVAIATKAFATWSQVPPLQRARILFKFKELIEKNSDELTKIIVAEHGKVYDDAKGSLTRGLEVVEFACGIPHLLKGEFTENVGTNVDKYIYENAAKFEKRVQALGGAKNHCVVMPDADLDQAVAGLMGAAYGSAGERCMAQSVAVAVGNIGDELVSKLTKEVNNLRVGPGLDKGVDMGPLVTAQHLEKVTSYIDLGVKEGAKLIVDGRKIKKPQGYEKGFYLGGCLFDHVKENMRIYKEEIFGPVLSVVRAKNFNEAADLINRHEFGNGVSIFTRDGDSARTFSSHIKVGMVGINIPIPVPMAFHSFGGWKRSLFGDQHVHGMEGVRFYTKLKTITSRWPSGIKATSNFTMPTMN